MKNLDIFICAHKDFDKYPKSPEYSVVSGKKLNININQIIEDPESPLQHSLGELSRMLWVNDNIKLKKYVGFCHYRSYFDFYDNIPNIDEIFKNNDIILPNKEFFRGSNLVQYNMSHNIYDLQEICNIINELYPDYSEDVNYVMNNNCMYSRNIFIMKSKDFKKYCKFIKTILQKFCNNHNFKEMDDINKYVEQNINNSLYDNCLQKYRNVEYQSRLLGFLGERITNIYINHNFKKPKCFNIYNEYNNKPNILFNEIITNSQI